MNPRRPAAETKIVSRCVSCGGWFAGRGSRCEECQTDKDRQEGDDAV